MVAATAASAAATITAMKSKTSSLPRNIFYFNRTTPIQRGIINVWNIIYLMLKIEKKIEKGEAKNPHAFICEYTLLINILNYIFDF